MAVARIPGQTPVRPPAPVGASGFTTNKQGAVNPNDPSVRSALAGSAAANPQAAGANGSAFAGVGGAQYEPYDPYGAAGADPILAKIHAITATARANAQSSALMQRNQLAVALGDATGISDDPNYVDAAAHNPNSILAQLAKSYGDTVHSHDETLNKDNLFYSGARAKTLADDANAYQGQQYTARSGALSQLGGIGSGLATALSGADSQDEQGLEAAYGRAQTAALANGTDPGQITNNAVTNQHPAAAATPPSGGFGNPTAQIGTVAGALARKVQTAAPKNAYLTSATKRG